MGNTAKVIGMVPVDERVKEVAHRILDDVVSVQTAISGQDYVPGVVRSGLNAIQVQARSLLSGGKIAPVPDGLLSQEYRQDMMELLGGLLDLLTSKVTVLPLPGELSDDDLRTIALAAKAAVGRITNYLTVKQAENRMQRREGGNGLAQPAA
ncbi:hypothetical protein [Thiovibrio frasassiensis]|uniref:Uncharacterized protein n=1 Tax=Thiovibrio frasassiensis TaxID=2984131 RepID=A0A9X4MFP8_9BACT|nr:hypothetical protein [Thiovibrio frasassiensis]MDG4475410.1 hypothetical protein [Thiovibrio frasassiensis]